MGLESATYIAGLVPGNPPSSDLESQGADHLRLIKSVLQNTFPGAAAPFYLPSAPPVNTVALTIAHQNALVTIDTTSAVQNVTLPALTAVNAGWSCRLIKLNTGTNPFFILPSAGTIQSGEYAGLSKARRCIPGHITEVIWSGTAWFAMRVPRVPVGSIITWSGSVAPPTGYELPNGQILNAANYPEYVAVMGAGNTFDVRARVLAAPDAGAGIWTAAVVGFFLGEISHTLTTSEVPQLGISGSASVSSGTITASTSAHDQGGTFGPQVGGASHTNDGGNSSVTINDTRAWSVSGLTTNSGGGGAHNNLQPTLVLNKLLVVE